jgi:hypothetical protein
MAFGFCVQNFLEDDKHERTQIYTNCKAMIVKRGYSLFHQCSDEDDVLVGDSDKECLVVKYFSHKVNKQDIQQFIQKRFTLYPFEFIELKKKASLVLVFKHVISVNVNDIKTMKFPIQIMKSSVLNISIPELDFKFEKIKLEETFSLLKFQLMSSKDVIAEFYGFNVGDVILVTRPITGEKMIRFVRQI